MSALTRLIPAIIATALVVGCGVQFTTPESGTEIFKGLEIRGARVTGAPLSVAVEVTQGYPLPVEIACLYEDDSKLTEDQKKVAFVERATMIGSTVLPANLDGRPDEETPVQTVSFDFQIDEPGNYLVACLTPAAPENGWSTHIKIAGGNVAAEGR